MYIVSSLLVGGFGVFAAVIKCLLGSPAALASINTVRWEYIRDSESVWSFGVILVVLYFIE